MRKKGFAIIIALFMCVSVIGCGAEKTTAEPVSSLSSSSVSEEAQKTPEKVMAERLGKEATTNTITEDLKKKALDMPYADYQTLPAWHGTTLVNKAEYGWTWGGHQDYTKELVGELAEVGFNFIRVVIDTRNFFLEDINGEPGQYFNGTSEYVNLQQLKNVDDLIAWCIDAGIHVCLDVHSTPGGYMIGGDEEASRELLFTAGSPEEQIFLDYWEFMAMRYSDVPNNALSFNLYNEPPFFATDEQYTVLMKKTLDVIRKTSPDRLIFIDMLQYGRIPVYGLVGEKVVQTFHSYDPYEFTHNLVDNTDYEAGAADRSAALREKVTYPLPAVCAQIRDEGYVVTGDFPAGTELTMRIDEGRVGTELVLSLDGKKVSSWTMDQEKLDKCGLIPDDENNFGIYFETNPDATGIEVKYVLEQDAKELRFDRRGKDAWIDLNALKVKTATYNTRLDAMWIDDGRVELPPTRVSIDEKGFVTVADDAAKYNFGKDSLKEMFSVYKQFREETGTKVMLQEFGDCVYTEINGAKQLYDDILSICDEFDFPWCHYAYDGADFSIVAISPEYYRREATYEKLSSGREICAELRDVLRKHMK